MKTTFVVLVCLAPALLAACGGDTRPLAQAPDIEGLPALPDDGPASAPAVHQSSGVETIVIDGKDHYSAASNASNVPSGLRLSSLPGGICWAVYQVSALAPQRYVTSIDLSEASVNTSYWIALANYGTGLWEVVKNSTLEADSFPIIAPDDYLSPAGNLYFALIVSGSTIIHTEATVHIVNDLPPQLDPPTGLTAFPGDSHVVLSWDAYTGTGATSLNVYQSPNADMSGAVLAGNEVLPGDDNFFVSGLSNGTLYYFALKATDGSLESDYSNITFATPQPELPTDLQPGGIWGRLGNDAAGTGYTNRVGPSDFRDIASVDLTSNRFAENCRTSPVVDSNGNVYALSRDGFFSSWTGDLANNRFSIDLSAADVRGDQVAPPQAPCIDSQNNIYFATVDSDTGAVVFWGFDADGQPIFDVEYPSSFSKGTDNDRMFPSLLIAGGYLISAVNNYTHPLAMKGDGSGVWNNPDYESLLEFSAEPVYNAGTNTLEWPCTVPGIAVGMQPNWMSLKVNDGSHFSDSRDIGRPICYFGGVALSGGRHVYSNHTRCYLLDNSDGSRIDQVNIGQSYYSGSTSYDPVNKVIYQPLHQDEGIVILGKLGIYQYDPAALPDAQLERVIDQPLGGGLAVTGKPAIDGSHAVFVAAEDGFVHRVLYNPALPLDVDNPAILRVQLDPADTFKFNSFALTDGTAYICSEQNKLYRIGNPFTD